MTSEACTASIPTDAAATEGFPQVVSALETSPPALVDHRARSRAVPAELAPPGRYLAFEDGDVTLLVALEDEIIRIGRGMTADLRLDDGRVSRHHAIVAQHGSGVRVLDDRSANGTFVNGRRVFQAELEDGDVIRLGPVVFRYAEVRAASTTTTRPRRSGPQPRSERAVNGWLATHKQARSRDRRAAARRLH